MSSADARPRQRSIWLRIAKSYLASLGVLYLLTGVLVIFAVLRHHVDEYHKALSLISSDLTAEYDECKGDLAKMKSHFREAVDANGKDNVFLMLAEEDGTVALQELSREPLASQFRRWIREAQYSTRRFEVHDAAGRGGGIAVRARRMTLSDGRTLVVGINVSNDERHAILVAALLLATLVLMVLLGGIVGVLVTRNVTAPLRRIVDAARRVEAGNYTTRVPVSSDGREITVLEGAFNTMCEKTEKTMTELRMLTDNIAHDLRTPLMRMRAAAETRMMGDTSDGQLAETVSEETSAMLEMINTMLEISQADSGISHAPREDLDLVPFAAHIVDLYSTLAEDRGISLTLAVPDSAVMFSGHKVKLHQMLGNLVDNAVKFTPDGGSVEVRISARPVRIEVSNTGPGIRAEDIPHVFRRFWRADTSRSRHGNGLGLALVEAIVKSYGGSVVCRSEPGEKTVFTVVF